MATHRLNFTLKALAALKPAAAGRTDYCFDTNRGSPRGFGLWITDRGAKTYMLYRKINGRPERIKLGRFGDISLDHARRGALKQVGRIADGENPQHAKRKLRGQPALGELFRLYIDQYAKLHTRRWRDQEADYARYLAHWESRRLVEIEKSDVMRLHAALGRDRGPYTANRQVEMLRALVNWGLANHEIDATALAQGKNPAADIKPFEETKRERFLRADEVAKFFRALRGETSIDFYDVWTLSLLTGARRANVLAMQWADVDLQAATWRIPEIESKTARPVTLPLVDDALRILWQRFKRRNGATFVFPSRGVTGHLISPKKAWRRLLDRTRLLDLIEMVGEAKGLAPKEIGAVMRESRRREAKALAEYQAEAQALGLPVDEAGLRDLRPHDLRRTLGSWQAGAGVSLPIIGATLGHKDAKSTQVYARLHLDPVRAAVAKATDALLIAGGMKSPPQARKRRKRRTRKPAMQTAAA